MLDRCWWARLPRPSPNPPKQVATAKQTPAPAKEVKPPVPSLLQQYDFGAQVRALERSDAPANVEVKPVFVRGICGRGVLSASPSFTQPNSSWAVPRTEVAAQLLTGSVHRQVLINTHLGRIFVQIHCMVQDRDNAEELTQMFFIKAMTSAATFAGRK
jgi:hypothetical protein